MSWNNKGEEQIPKQMSLFSQIVLGISLARMTIFSTLVSYLSCLENSRLDVFFPYPFSENNGLAQF